MEFVLQWYPGDQVVHFVLVVFVQVAVVAIAAWFLARMAARLGAAALYAVWLTALAVVPVGLIWAAVSAAFSWAIIPVPILPAPAPAPPTLEYAKVSQSSAVGARIADDVDPEAGFSLRLALARTIRLAQSKDAYRAAFAIGSAVWLCGASCLAFRLLAGLYTLRRLQRTARRVDTPTHREMMTRICRELGLRCLPRLLASRSVAGPISLGIFRPTVILPEGLLSQLTAAQLHDVLVHECGHFLNRDHLSGLVERVLEIILWPHPALRVIRGELSRAREELCDNYVLQLAQRPDYARTLLMISQRTSGQACYPSAVGFLQGPRPLEARVRGLLDIRRRLTTRLSYRAWMAIGAVLMGLAGIAAVLRLVPAEPDPPIPLAAIVEFPAVRVSVETPPLDADLPFSQRSGMVAPLQERVANQWATLSPGVVFQPELTGGILSRRPVATTKPFDRFVAEPVNRPTLATVSRFTTHSTQATESVLPAVASSQSRMGGAAKAVAMIGSLGASRKPSAATVAETTFDIGDVLQPVVLIEPVSDLFAVTVQMSDLPAARFLVEPAKARKVVYEESLTTRIAFELTVEPTSLLGQFRLIYRFVLQLGPQATIVWESSGELIEPGHWKPLIRSIDRLNTTSSESTVLTAREVLRLLDEANRLTAVAIDMLND